MTRRRPGAALLAGILLLVSLALAGCVGTGPPGDGGDGPGADPAGTGGDGASGDGATSDGQGGGDPDDPSSSDGDEASGDGDGTDDGTADTDDGTTPAPRTPTDAVPGHDPVETGEGWARFRVEGTVDLAAKVDVVEAADDEKVHNLSLQGDELLVEVLLTWEGASDPDRVDLNLFLTDHRRRDVATGVHGQRFINDHVCSHVGECIFVFPPNGTTWEHAAAGPGPLSEVQGPADGDWLVRVTEENVWTAGAVQGAAGLGEGVPYVLDVWVHTVPAEPVHEPSGPTPDA